MEDDFGTSSGEMEFDVAWTAAMGGREREEHSSKSPKEIAVTAAMSGSGSLSANFLGPIQAESDSSQS
jgi:hypothetical protein